MALLFRRAFKRWLSASPPESAGTTGQALRISSTPGVLEWYTPAVVADTLVATLLDSPGTQDGEVRIAKGYYTADDGYYMKWRWNSSSTQAADGVDATHPGLCFQPSSVSGAGRWIAQVDKTYINAKWFGCKADNTQDDTPYIQRAVDRAININGDYPWSTYIVKLPVGLIRTTDTIHLGYGVNGAGTATHCRIALVGSDEKGGYDNWGTVIRPTFVDRPVVNFEGVLASSIKKIGFFKSGVSDPPRAVTGMTAEKAGYETVFPYNVKRPFAAVTIDAYACPEPTGTYYQNVPAQGEWSDHAKSSDVLIEACDFRYFECGVCIRPSGGDANSEYVVVRDCHFEKCKFAFSINSSQCRGNQFLNNILLNCFSAVGIGQYGPGLGHSCVLENNKIDLCAWWVYGTQTEWAPQIVVRNNLGEGCVGFMDLTAGNGFNNVIFEGNTCNCFDGDESLAEIRYHFYCPNLNLVIRSNNFQNEGLTKPSIIIRSGLNTIVEGNTFRRDASSYGAPLCAVVPCTATTGTFRIEENTTAARYPLEAVTTRMVESDVTYSGSRNYSGTLILGVGNQCVAGDIVSSGSASDKNCTLFECVSTGGQYGTIVWKQLTDTTSTAPLSTSATITRLTADRNNRILSLDAEYRRTLISAQKTLVAGTNIKTINNSSPLGSGNLQVGIDEAATVRRFWNFDGVNDGASLGARLTTGSVSNITCSCWFKINAFGVIQAIAIESNWSLLITDSGRLYVGIDNVFALSAPASLAAGVWYHGAFTFDGSTARLYLNGTQVSTVSYSGAIPSGATNFQIGASAGTYFLNGSVSDVRVYNATKSAGEIEAIYNQDATPDSIDMTGLIAWYPCNEVSGTTGYDYSGNGKNLALSNINQATFFGRSYTSRAVILGIPSVSRKLIESNSMFEQRVALGFGVPAPASASSPGVAGTVTWDSNYIYHCTATNTWKRVAIATW